MLKRNIRRLFVTIALLSPVFIYYTYGSWYWPAIMRMELILLISFFFGLFLRGYFDRSKNNN